MPAVDGSEPAQCVRAALGAVEFVNAIASLNRDRGHAGHIWDTLIAGLLRPCYRQSQPASLAELLEGIPMRFTRNWRGKWVVDLDEFAAKLGITPRQMQGEMDLGFIRLLVETGRGADEGRSRVTVRCRDAAWQGIFDKQGYLLDECRPPMDQLPEQLMR